MGLRLSNGIPLNCFNQEMRWIWNGLLTCIQALCMEDMQGSGLQHFVLWVVVPTTHIIMQRMIYRFLLHSNVLGKNLQIILLMSGSCWCNKGTSYRWISWRILPWELEGITSPYCLLIGQHPHHMTLCPPVAIVKRCFGIRLYETHLCSIIHWILGKVL